MEIGSTKPALSPTPGATSARFQDDPVKTLMNLKVPGAQDLANQLLAALGPRARASQDDRNEGWKKVYARIGLLEQELLQALAQIKSTDLQQAMETMSRSGFQLQQADIKTASAEQAVAMGLISAIASPVAAHSQLEGAIDPAQGQRATLTEARRDERALEGDRLDREVGRASELRLGDQV